MAVDMRRFLGQAKPLGDVTVASIFVNHVQFLSHENFGTYLRPLKCFELYFFMLGKVPCRFLNSICLF